MVWRSPSKPQTWKLIWRLHGKCSTTKIKTFQDSRKKSFWLGSFCYELFTLVTRQAGHDDKLNFHTDFFQVCQHRAGDHGKAPLPDNTSLGSCNQSPFLLSLCQHECRPNPANHQHSARNKFQKFLFIADFPAPLCHVQEVKL